MLVLEKKYRRQSHTWDKISIIKTATIAIAFSCFFQFSVADSGSITTSDTEEPENKTINIEPEGLCETEQCINLATDIWSNMDRTVNPCNNFYNYVCGGFYKNISSFGKFGIDTYSVVQENVHVKLADLLQSEHVPTDPKVFNMTKTFYKNCMIEYLPHQKGIRTLLGITNDLGGWPLLVGNTWHEDGFDWLQSASKINEMGFKHQGFISVTVTPDVKNSSTYRINVGESVMHKRYPEFITSSQRNLKYFFKSFMSEIITIIIDALGMQFTSEHRKEMMQAFDFLEKIANSLDKSPPPTDEVHNLMTIHKLEDKYPSLPWLEYINKMIKPTIPIGENETVNVLSSRYFTRLEKLLVATPKRIQMNAMMIGVVYASLPYLNSRPIRERFARYQNIIQFFGRRRAHFAQLAPKWKECVLLTTEHFPLAVGALYARTYFNDSDKKHVDEIAVDVKQEVLNLLQNTAFMSEKTKLTAIEKLKSTKMYLAYPSELLDDQKINEYYKNMEVNDTCNLATMLNVSHFYMEKQHARLGQSADTKDWANYGSTTKIKNLLYYLRDNTIEAPAGFLQKPFYDKERPSYMNYATIGSLIGMLAAHPWDDTGRYYDKDGNSVDWWDTKTKVEYHKRAGCYIHQYDQIAVPGTRVDGLNTEVSNIADHIGLTAAYRAYNDWMKRHGTERPLPGLPYNTRQLFWISAANMHCYKYSWQHYRRNTLGIRSPGMARVIGAFANVPEFARDFNCLTNSKMNPKKKCSLL